MPRTYTLTYDVVTPESAEQGDYADHGFGDGRSLHSTSMELIDVYARGSEEWRAAFDAARAAATGTIEPDEVGAQDARDALLEKEQERDPSAAECESRAAVRLLVDLLTRDYGATEPSCSDWSEGCWYTEPDGSTDYSDGSVTRVSVHLDGWTEDEQRAIYAAVTGRKP